MRPPKVGKLKTATDFFRAHTHRLRVTGFATRCRNRAIKRGTGEIEGAQYEEVVYEGYGPGGVAVLVEVLTDNKNRTVAAIRNIFDKYSGNLGESGCVAWMFDKKGMIVIGAEGLSEDDVMELGLEAGAEDVTNEGDTFEILTDPADFEAVRSAVEETGWKIEIAEVTMIPQTTVKLDGKKAMQMLKMMDALDDNEDLQQVYANFDISEEEMMEASA